MKIAIYVTNFKNDLMEAISLNATRLAFLVGKQADCTLLVPGEISNDAGEMPGLNWESYDRSYTYASKGRVVKNIIGLGATFGDAWMNSTLSTFMSETFWSCF
jgi:hypothetical protein